MSIRIHTGFRFVTTDLAAIYRTVDRFRVELQPVVTALVAARVADLAVTALDRGILGLPTDEPGSDDPRPLIHAGQVYERNAAEARERGIRHPDDDFECTLRIIPQESMVLGRMQTEQAAFWDRWCAQPGVMPFAYQNSTDRPASVSASAWEARRLAWEAAYRPHGEVRDAALVGFDVVCAPPRPLRPGIEAILAAVPPFEHRVARAARVMLQEEHLRLHAAGEEVAPREAWATVSRRLRVYTTWLATRDGQAALRATEAKVAAGLPRHVTPTLLGVPHLEPDAVAARARRR